MLCVIESQVMSLTHKSFLSYFLVYHGTYCTQTDGEYGMCVLRNQLTDTV